MSALGLGRRLTIGNASPLCPSFHLCAKGLASAKTQTFWVPQSSWDCREFLVSFLVLYYLSLSLGVAVVVLAILVLSRWGFTSCFVLLLPTFGHSATGSDWLRWPSWLDLTQIRITWVPTANENKGLWTPIRLRSIQKEGRLLKRASNPVASLTLVKCFPLPCISCAFFEANIAIGEHGN